MPAPAPRAAGPLAAVPLAAQPIKQFGTDSGRAAHDAAPVTLQPVVVDLYHGDQVSDLAVARHWGIRGVIHKATEGERFADRLYAERRRLAGDAGLMWGAYHFLRPGSVASQAAQFLAFAEPDAGTLVALDHEDARVPLAAASEFLDRIATVLGRKAVLYSGFLIKRQLGSRRDPALAAHRLWLSQYGPHPVVPPNWPGPWLWQFTGDGVGPAPHSVPGIAAAGGVDLNHFDGTPAELAQQWAA
jgi:lysozyme